MTIEEHRKHWEDEILNPTLEKFPERKTEFYTSSGIPVPCILTPEDGEVDYLVDLNYPGEYPFTRGVQATMYRGRLWTMRQYAGYASAEESNKRYRYLLDQGQTGLSVAFDLPTQIGYDADDLIAQGEVGKVGVSISSLLDMEILFKEISKFFIGNRFYYSFYFAISKFSFCLTFKLRFKNFSTNNRC